MKLVKTNLFLNHYLIISLLIISLLITKESGAENNIPISTIDSQYIAGVNPLMSTVSNDDIEGVKFFISSDPLLVNQKNLGGATSLHIACRNGNLAIVQLLVNSGANLNATDNEGWTPLMRAAFSGNPALIDFLLDRGANPSKHNVFNETALIHAAHANCFECIDILFNKYDLTSKLDKIYLQEQIKDAYVIFKNKNNQEAQKLLASYLVKNGGSKIAEFNFELKDTDSNKVVINKAAALSSDLPDSNNNLNNNKFVDNKKSASSYKFSGKKIASKTVVDEDKNAVKNNDKNLTKSSIDNDNKTKFKIKLGAAPIIKTKVKASVIKGSVKVKNEATSNKVIASQDKRKNISENLTTNKASEVRESAAKDQVDSVVNKTPSNDNIPAASVSEPSTQVIPQAVPAKSLVK